MNAIILSISSDIGAALAHRWLRRGWSVFGTYRTRTPAVDELAGAGARLYACDFSDSRSVSEACSLIAKACAAWDVLVVAPATQDPIGLFTDCDFEEWQGSLDLNFTQQMRSLHELLPSRNRRAALGPCTITWAGGATNNATKWYSAYTVSKIAQIKMMELLDAEMPDTRFVILGPGWVKTKIHQSTIAAGDRAGTNYERTRAKLASDDCTPMDRVLDCCDWVVNSPREVVGGRNFSVVFDQWGSAELEKKLREDPDMYKLRRHGNNWLPRDAKG